MCVCVGGHTRGVCVHVCTVGGHTRGACVTTLEVWVDGWVTILEVCVCGHVGAGKCPGFFEWWLTKDH